MLPIASEIDAADVLRMFRHEGPYLFAGAAFTTAGVLAAAYGVVRGKRDPLLTYFAVFAALYGVRLWVQSDLVKFNLQDSVIYWRIRSAIDYLMPIPALLFFNSMGLFRKWVSTAFYVFAAVGIGLTAAVFLFGPSSKYDSISRGAAIAAVLALVAELSRKGAGGSPEMKVVRRGVVGFGIFALFDNLAAPLALALPKLEPIGFLGFLGAMGYVAANRTLARDHELQEIQKELDIARRIQLSILPREFPDSAHFRVAARYVPMTSVAGDFYDYVIADRQQAGLLVADVSGHGVPAALIASMVKLAAASQRSNGTEPGAFLLGMNAALCGNTQNQFVTAAYLYLNAESRELRYSAAGHPPLLLGRAGKVIEIEENGLMLAAFDFAAYTETRRTVENGDRFLMYTDGVIEAADANDEFFGRERLGSLLIETAGLPASEAVDQIVAAVRAWSPRQDDDVTVLICDFLDGEGIGPEPGRAGI